MLSSLAKAATMTVAFILLLSTTTVYSIVPFISRYPHAVLLKCYHDKKLDHTCGSSILNQKVLLTAARCLYRREEKWDIKAFAGSASDGKEKIVRKVQHYLIHPAYDPEHHSNNIGLANLVRPLLLGPTVKRVIIKPTFGSDAVAASLRRDNAKKLTIQDQNSCKKVYEEMGAPTATGMFCGLENFDDSASQSKYGDALMSEDDESIQIGIVSFQSKRHSLAAYTNVTYYYPWIKHHAQILFCTNRTIMYILAIKDNSIIV